MKLFVTIFLLLLSCWPAIAQNSKQRPQGVDYIKCSQMINGDWDLGAYSIFRVDKYGGIDVKNSPFSFLEQAEGNGGDSSINFHYLSGDDKKIYKVLRDSKFNIKKIEREIDSIMIGERTSRKISMKDKYTIEFDIRGNQCVVSRVLRKNAGSSGTIGHLNLCKDIANFFQDNPKLKDCTSQSLNNNLLSTFNRHIKTDNKFLAGSKEKNALYSKSFEELINEAKTDRVFFKTSPLTNATIMLERCYRVGLGPFIKDNTIWEKASPSTPGQGKKVL